MKKTLSFILAVVMLISMFAGLQISSSALSPSGSCGENVNYTFNSSSGKLTISGTGVMGKYFPATTPFAYANEIKTIVIENGVKDIGQYMFYHCENVTSVTIPASVTEIKYDAFDTCKSLKNITIPNGVVTLGGQAFCDCEALESISIPKSVTTVGDRAFLACKSLTDVYYAGTQSEWNNISISDDNNDYFTSANIHCNAMGGCGANLTYYINDETKTLTISGTGDMYDYTSINRSPFYQNIKIEKIVISYGVTSIGDNAFQYCSKVKSVDIPSTVSSIGTGAFGYCYYLKSVIIPSGVDIINVSTFYYCTRLEAIEIPTSVKTIGNSAFSGCSKLSEVAYKGTKISWNTINIDSTANTAINDATKYYLACLCGETVIGKVNLSSGVLTVFGTGAMYNYPIEYPGYDSYKEYIKEIVVEDGVTYVGDAAFYELTNVTKASIAGSVAQIGDGAFSGCTVLESIELNEGLETIGDSAFNNCVALKSVTVPGTVTRIKNSAFNNCAAMTDLVIKEGTVYKTIDKYAFKFCMGLKNVTIPDNILSLDKDVFNGASDTFTVTASCNNGYIAPIIEDTNRKWEKVHGAPLPSIKQNEVEPTCTKPGSYDEVVLCSICNDELSREHIDVEPTGHSFFNTKFVAATSVKPGYENQKCSVCNETRRVILVPTGKVKTLKCKKRTATTETLIWSSVKGAQGYQIQLSNAQGNAWGKIYNAKKGTSFNFSKLTAGGAYKFRVRIYAKDVNGDWSFGAWTTIISPTLPAGSSISKLASAKKAFTATWTKRAGVTGYQIQYATNSKFKSAKLKTVKGASSAKLTLSGLKGSTRYYVRVRTYKAISGKNYFSPWSGSKSIVTKK